MKLLNLEQEIGFKQIEVHTGYFLSKVEIKDSNIMIDRKNIFGHPVRSDGRTYDNIKIIETG